MTQEQHRAISYQVDREEQEMRKRYKKHIDAGAITADDVIELSVDVYRCMMRAFDVGDIDSILAISWLLKKHGLPQKFRDKIDRINRLEEQGYITQFRPSERRTK